MTWPLIRGLVAKIHEFPPTDLVVGAMAKANAPKPIAEAIKTSGLPVRKGRVRKRGD
jgi:hypothetical protein